MSDSVISAQFEASVRELGEKVAKAQDELIMQIAQKFSEALGCDVSQAIRDHMEVRPYALNQRIVLFDGVPFCYIVTRFDDKQFTVRAESADIGGHW